MPPLFHRRAGNSGDIGDIEDIDRKLKNPWPSESFVELNFELSNYSKDIGDGISRIPVRHARHEF